MTSCFIDVEDVLLIALPLPSCVYGGINNIMISTYLPATQLAGHLLLIMKVGQVPLQHKNGKWFRLETSHNRHTSHKQSARLSLQTMFIS